MQKRKPNLSPEAARLLEQFRNKGKAPGAESPDSLATDSSNGGTPKTSTPPPAAQMRRSGTRGK